MAYTTAALLKSYLGITGTTDDTLLGNLLARAESIIDAYTGRHFEAATETRYFTSADTDGQELLLYGHDLLAVTKLTNGDGVEVIAADYRLFPRNETPKWAVRLDESKSWNWSTGDSEVSIAGSWGYATSAPADIVHACIRLASFLYRQKDSSADIDRPIVTGDGVTLMPSGLPNDVQKMLDRYKRRIA